MKKVIETIIITVSLLSAGCDKPINLKPDSDFNYAQLPVLAPNEDLSTETRPVYVRGPIYPSEDGAGFELDAPVIPDSDAPNAGKPYFGFELSIQVTGYRVLKPLWHNGRNVVKVEKVDGPCDPGTSNERRLMDSRSERSRGIKAPASYNKIIDEKLAQDTPLYWVTCHDNIQGEAIKNNNGTTVTSLIAFLIPKSLVSDSSSLQITVLPLAGGNESDPLVIEMSKSPFMMSVIGDSVAWGQGIRPANTYTQRLFRDLVRESGSGRYRNYAHSGAVLRNRLPSIGFQDNISGLGGAADILGNANSRFNIVNSVCSEGKDLHGEVPRSNPSIQCQVLDSVTRACVVGELVDGVPSFDCSMEAVRNANNNSTLSIFDTRPRWDYVVMNGCVNDMDGAWIHKDISLTDPKIGKLLNRISRKCNLANGLFDVRRFLPNATIVFHSYHRIIDRNSINAIKQSCIPSATNIFSGLPYGILQIVLNNALSLRANWVADRSGLFMVNSAIIQQSSIQTINNQAVGGVGRILFASMAPVFPGGRSAFSPAERVFSLDCSTPTFEPLDTEYGTRRQACAEQAAQLGLPANSLTEEKCKRASAFHPNQQAQELMFQRIKQVMEEGGAYP